MSNLIEKVKEAIAPVLEREKVELVEVEFAKKHGEDNLTVFIHKAGGISLDDCERVHLAIDPVIDLLDPTNGQPYVLNVSSPGLDRPFKTQRDFERNYGQEVEVKLFAPLKGRKTYEGVLVCKDENTTTICAGKGERKKEGKDKREGTGSDNDEDKSEIKIENGRIVLVRPLVRF
ncbi:MAG: ribosome maturation factor RimP [Firmicutes bacterium]|nr:ribosome maturation factor RimP [Bacillota bacterium]